MEELYAGHGWKIVLEEAALPDGRKKTAARAQRADSVHILAFPTDETILLLREYRPYYGQYVWMLPSGRIDKETDMLVAAQRELQEETGFRAGRIEFLASTRHSESIISANHFFRAHDLTHSPLPQDEDELIEVHEVSPQEALKRIEESPVVHLASAYALRRFMHG